MELVVVRVVGSSIRLPADWASRPLPTMSTTRAYSVLPSPGSSRTRLVNPVEILVGHLQMSVGSVVPYAPTDNDDHRQQPQPGQH